MRQLLFVFTFLFASIFAYAQEVVQDDRTYEIRYWQNMINPGSSPILIDTMVYYGTDRTGFDYSSADCISYFCKEEDNLTYSILQEFSGEETEWMLGKFFIRRMKTLQIPFRSKEREVYWVYISDHNNRNTGYGTYSLVSKEFGVICRWNSDGEFFQLNRIDVVKEGQTLEELDLIPMMDKLYASEVFRN